MSTSIGFIMVNPSTHQSQQMPQKNKSNSFVELSKHSCMNAITVFCSPPQVTHWKPVSGRFFLVSAGKMGQFLIRKQSKQPGAVE